MTRFCTALLLWAWPALGLAQDDDAADQAGIKGTLIRTLGDRAWRSTFELTVPAYSTDGKTLAFGGTWKLGLWDAAAGKLLRAYDLSGCGYFWSVAWAPDGSLYAGGQHHHVMRWDPQTHKLAEQYEWHQSVVKKISLSADGSVLASMDVSKNVAIWEIAKRKLRHTLKLETSATWPDIALSPDGKWLAASGVTGKDAVVLYDAGTGQRVAAFDDRISAHNLKLTFTPDSRALVVGSGGIAWVWDVAQRKIVHRFVIKGDGIEALAVCPKGKHLAVVGWGETVYLYDLKTGRWQRSLSAAGDRLHGVAFSPDGAVIAAGGNGRVIHRWQVATGEPLTPSNAHTGGVEAVAWRSGERVVTAGLDRSVRYWNPDTGKLDKVVALPDVFPMAFSADALTLVGRSDEFVHVLDLATGKEKSRVRARVHWNQEPALTPDGKLLAYAFGNKQLHVRAADATEVARALAVPPRMVFATTFTPDGTRLVAGFEQGYKQPFKPLDARAIPRPRERFKEPTVFVYDVKTGAKLLQLGEELASVMRLAVSPCGRYLAAGDLDNKVHVWDLRLKKKLPGVIDGHTTPTCLAFSPDGRWLASLGRMSGTGFSVHEVATMSPIAQFAGHQVQTATLAFAPDGRRIVSGGLDTLALIWDLTGIAPEGTLPKATLTDGELEKLWSVLGETPAAKAQRPLFRLVAAGEASVKFIQRRLEPTPHLDPKAVARWLEQLDDTQFNAREEAFKQLERLGDAIETELRARLEKKPSLEMQRRLQRLLDKLGPTTEHMRVRRALCVLEQIGTASARAILETMAGGEPRALITQDAEASLKRLRDSRR